VTEQEERTNDVEEATAESQDVESLKRSLNEAQTKVETYLANWQRAEADLINYRRRAEQEREEISKFANTTLILSLLPVLDDLERALCCIPPRLEKLNWIDGIRLIERKLRVTLEAQGLSEIRALGEPFDPNLHEAVRQDKGKDGIVVEEVQKGYKLRDRVIRPAMVVVGSGEGEEMEEEKEE
jgi:molecular chaperone GrpE